MISKKISKIILLGIFLVLLIFLADFIFFYHNQPYSLAKGGIFVANFFLERDDLKNVIHTLNITSNIYINKNKASFPYLDKKYFARNNINKVDYKTQKQIKEMLYDQLSRAKDNAHPEMISNIYYHIGLILHDSNYSLKGNSYFITAINLTPMVGFLHLELANAWFLMGEKNEALKVLNDCREIRKINQGCDLYLKESVANNLLGEVGWLSKLIDKYHLEKNKD